MSLSNGYHDLPPGKIASVVTYLEMTAATPAIGDLCFSVTRIKNPDLGWYRTLFRRIGDPWLWFGHAVMEDAELAALLGDPGIEVYALSGDRGLMVLDRRVEGEVELLYFGLVPEAVGTGAGKQFLEAGIQRAFSKPIRRFWLHTCSNDHPRALGFYLRAGFRPYKRAVEIADDPRLQGWLPRTAGPHVPIL